MKSDQFVLSLQGPYRLGPMLTYLRSSSSATLEQVTDTGFRRALEIGPGVVVSIEQATLLPSVDPLHTIWAEHLTPALVEQTRQYVRRWFQIQADAIRHRTRTIIAKRNPS